MNSVDGTPLAYRWLYSRGTAAALVLSSGLVLAVSQTHVIRDWLATLHPSWTVPWLWANAAGFELVVLAVGLVLALSPTRKLWAMELFLVAVSCAAAWDSGHSVPGPLRSFLGSLMPLQYLAAVLAGHELAAVQRQTGRKSDKVASSVPVKTAARVRSSAGRNEDKRPDRERALALLQAGQRATEVAAETGVTERTIRRWRGTMATGTRL